MLHHLASATIQVAKLVNYNCHPSRDNQSQVFLQNLCSVRVALGSWFSIGCFIEYFEAEFLRRACLKILNSDINM